MKKIFRNYWPLAVLVLFFVMLCAGVKGQEGNNQSLLTSSPTSNDSPAFPPQAMIALVLPVLVGMLKGFVPEKFRKWIPLAMPLLGELLTQLLSSLPSGSGVVAGLAGVGVREAVDNAKKKPSPGRPQSDGKSGNYGTYGILPFVGFVIFVAIGSGCQVLDKAASAVTRPKSMMVTNEVIKFMTNVVAIPVPVPGQTVMVTNFVDRVSTVTNREVVTNLVYEVKNELRAGVAAGQTVAALAPPPYSTAAAGILGVVSAGLGFLAARKNKQADLANQQLKAVIAGVEETAIALPGGDSDKVKENIQKVSKLLGVASELHASVQAMTEKK